MKLQVQSLASLSGLRVQCCCELWCRLAAIAPIWPLATSLGTSTCHGCGPKMQKKKKNHTTNSYSNMNGTRKHYVRTQIGKFWFPTQLAATCLINKVLLEHSQIQSFICSAWLQQQNRVAATEQVWPSSLEHVLPGSLRKHLPIPVSNERSVTQKIL